MQEGETGTTMAKRDDSGASNVAALVGLPLLQRAAGYVKHLEGALWF